MASRPRRAAAAFLRYLLAAVLLATAAGKSLDLRGFASAVASYRVLPTALVPAAALAVPVAEMVVAFWLLAATRLPAAALACAGLHGIYAAWSAAAVTRGLKLSNCGCFGVFLARPLGWSTVVEDLTLAGSSLLLFALARGSGSARFSTGC